MKMLSLTLPIKKKFAKICLQILYVFPELVNQFVIDITLLVHW